MPSDFGLMAIALSIISLPAYVGFFGLDQAIIQKDKNSNDELSAIFWTLQFFGLLYFIIIFYLSNDIALFFEEKNIAPILKILSIKFIFSPQQTIQKMILIRSLKFKKIGIVDNSINIVSGILTLYLAYNGYGVWSLVTQVLMTELLLFAVYQYLSHWTPSYSLNISFLTGYLDFSLGYMGTSLLGYLTRHLDKLIIANAFSSSELGYYSRSSKIISRIDFLGKSISEVLFPIYSTIKNQYKRTKKIHLSTLKIILLLTLPFYSFLIINGEPIILIFLGEKWAKMVPLIKIFSFYGIVRTVGTTNRNIYLAYGQTKLQFKINLISRFFIFAGMFLGLKQGYIGVAMYSTIGATIGIFPLLYYACKLIKLNLIQFFKYLFPELILNITNSALFILLKNYFNSNPKDIYSLIFEGFVFVITYYLLIIVFKNNSYTKILEILKNKVFNNS